MRLPVVAAILALSALCAPVAAAAGATPPRPGAVADPALDRTIRAEQLALVTRAADVAGAKRAADRDRAGLDADVAAYGRDSAAADAAALHLAARARDLVAAHARLRAADARRRADRAAVAGDLRRLQALAVGWYIGGFVQSPEVAGDLAGAQQVTGEDAELAAVTTSAESARRRDVAAGAAAARSETRYEASLRRSVAAEVVARTASAGRLELLLAASTEVLQARHALSSAIAGVEAARARRIAAVAAVTGPEGRSPDPVPTILGGSALTAAQLVAWFGASGYVAATPASIGQLAGWYIEEGRAEGVRGDIAFAQAVVETGGFASPDAVRLNNYAGIGHCDTCRAGLRFPSPRYGVRGQVQLLRTFADPTLTEAQLADPPALAVLAPSLQSSRGCCRTWSSLTGHWATDPDYGRTILEVYQTMLSFALAGEQQ
jgi:hypothetical protein